MLGFSPDSLLNTLDKLWIGRFQYTLILVIIFFLFAFKVIVLFDTLLKVSPFEEEKKQKEEEEKQKAAEVSFIMFNSGHAFNLFFVSR